MSIVSLRNQIAYDDQVIADGIKHKVVVRGGQYLVLEKGKRHPDMFGDHGSTRFSRDRALHHFDQLEQSFLAEV